MPMKWLLIITTLIALSSCASHSKVEEVRHDVSRRGTLDARYDYFDTLWLPVSDWNLCPVPVDSAPQCPTVRPSVPIVRHTSARMRSISADTVHDVLNSDCEKSLSLVRPTKSSARENVYTGLIFLTMIVVLLIVGRRLS